MVDINKVPRKDEYWGDGAYPGIYDTIPSIFPRLKCNKCGGLRFEILSPNGEYQTIAVCWECKKATVVHDG